MKWIGNEGECDTLDVLMLKVEVERDAHGKWQATARIFKKGSAAGGMATEVHHKVFQPCDTDTEARARVDAWLLSCSSALIRKV